MDKALLDICLGEADTSTLLEIFPNVRPDAKVMRAIVAGDPTERDRKVLEGFAVFLKVAGKPPLPVEDPEDEYIFNPSNVLTKARENDG